MEYLVRLYLKCNSNNILDVNDIFRLVSKISTDLYANNDVNLYSQRFSRHGGDVMMKENWS